MNKSLVTLYITNFNYEFYLEECIQSVLSQTYELIEIIIIDDGSTDNSREVLNQYSNNLNVQIIFQNQKGLSASNNVAIKNAKGKYIIRLDADDYLRDNAIESMVKVLDEDSSVALVFPDYTLVDKEGNEIKTIKRHDFEDEVKLFDQPAHGACTMIRMDKLIELGGYDEEFDRQDGYDLWLKVIQKYNVKNINEPLFYYRQHNSNLTQNESELLFTRAKIKAKAIKRLKKKNVSVLTVIPVRGNEIDSNSKPLKKILDMELIDWTIKASKESAICQNIWVSTPSNNLIDHIEQKYGGSINTFKRDKSLAKLNTGIEETLLELLDFYCLKNNKPDYVLILYIEYPFKKSWQIDESLHTAQLFDVDIVDGVIQNNNIFYKHDGSGLKPIVTESFLHLERDQLYRRVGAINLIRTDFLLSGKKIMEGKIGHISLDQKSAFQIKSVLDWEIAQALAKIKDTR